MSNIRQRAIKASELTQTELDANFKKRVTAKTVDYTITKNDNRDTLEFNGTSKTCTLLAASVLTNTSTGSETGEFELTIKNLNSTTLTITPNGSDTVDGVTGSFTIAQYETVILQTNNATTGWNILNAHIEEPDVSGYLKGHTEYLETTVGAHATVLSIISVSTWTTVGTSGSTATLKWAALNIVPTNAKWVELKLIGEISSSSQILIYKRYYARKGGDTTAKSNRNMIFTIGDTDSANPTHGARGVNSGIRVPVDMSDVNNIFELLVEASVGTALDVGDLILTGWGV